MLVFRSFVSNSSFLTVQPVHCDTVVQAASETNFSCKLPYENAQLEPRAVRKSIPDNRICRIINVQLYCQELERRTKVVCNTRTTYAGMQRLHIAWCSPLCQVSGFACHNCTLSTSHSTFSTSQQGGNVHLYSSTVVSSLKPNTVMPTMQHQVFLLRRNSLILQTR